jgi:hypothetical protein
VQKLPHADDSKRDEIASQGDCCCAAIRKHDCSVPSIFYLPFLNFTLASYELVTTFDPERRE